ncbi:MAG: hypothetical protein LUE10_07960 [Alistipes sp.]|nr:hypothetical protein [Alistipes sp.]
MALEKDFLRPGPSCLRPSQDRFAAGIALGLGLALVMYCLMYYYRELLRVIWTDQYFDILVLPPGEMNFYNVVCAYIGAIFGQSLCLTFWLWRPLQKTLGPGRKAARILVDLWPLNFVFLGMFAGLFCQVGLVMFWRTDVTFGLYPGYNIYFILMVAVLFLRPWLTICRIFKRKGLKWMAVSAALVSLFSFGISRINHSYPGLDRKLLERSVYHNYRIDWPQAEQSDIVRGGGRWFMPEGNIYVANRIGDADTAIVFLINNTELQIADHPSTHILQEVDPDSIGEILAQWEELKPLNPYGYDGNGYRLKINRDIPMALVNKLKGDLSAAGVRRVHYALVPSLRDPHLSFRYYDDRFMLSAVLPAYYSSPDSLRKVWRAVASLGNTINVSHAGDGTYIVGGKAVKKDQIRDRVKTLIAADPDYMVIFSIGDGDSFQNYTDVVSSVTGAVNSLRREWIESGPDAGQYRFGTEQGARAAWPIRIFELTEDMKRDLSLP